MKPSLVCLISAICLSSVFSAPITEDKKDDGATFETKLIEYTNTRTDDTYEYKYFLTDGSSQEQKGTLKDVNGAKVYTVKGRYTWILEDDLKLVVEYEADENGYRIINIYASSGDRFISGKAIESLLG